MQTQAAFNHSVDINGEIRRFHSVLKERSSCQGVMFYYVPWNKKKKEKKADILLHIWHTLISPISTFRLEMKSVKYETAKGIAADPMCC